MSPLVLTGDRDQVDRWDVAGDAVDAEMQAVVEGVDVAAGQTARGGDDVFDGECQIVDGAQDATVGGLGHGHLPGIEFAERIDGQVFGCSAAWIAETTGGPIGRNPAAVTFGMNTENKVPAWVTSRHLRRSILIRWAYQSRWPAWPMAGSDTPSSANTLAVHRNITSHDRRQTLGERYARTP